MLRSVQGGVTADCTYTVEPLTEDETRVSLVADGRASGMWAVVAPLVRLMVERADSGQIDALEAWVETP